MIQFRGLSAFPITPMNADGQVQAAILRRLVRRLVEARVDSIGLLGSTGSYPYLNRDERRRAIEAALEETGGRVPLLVGIGALRTDETVRLTQDARATGADAGLLAPVSYAPLTEDEVFAHFEAVAGASDLPIVIYNNPGTTHFSFSDGLIGRLAKLPTVKAVKNPAPEPAAAPAAVAALRAQVPADFSVGFSGDWNTPEALLVGGQAWYSVLAGTFPAPCLQIRDAAARGDADEVRRLNAGLAPLWTLFKRHGGKRVVYAAANLTGLSDTQPPRPILPLAGEARDEVARVLAAVGLA